MDPLANLEEAVTKTKGTNASAIALIQGFKAALDAAGTDKVKLKALSDALSAEEAGLASAVAANPLPPGPTPPP